MKCGCVAQGTRADGKPVCVVHIGILPGAEEPMPTPNLEGRFAFCSYCKSKRPSDATLPFFTLGRFQFSAGRDMTADEFYCGCQGWD